MPDYVVKTTFTAKDHVSDTYDVMGRSADKFGDRAASSFRRAGKEGHGFGSIVKGLIAHDMIQGIGNGMRKVGMDFLRFDDVIVGAAARFDDIGPNAKNATQRIDQLGKSVRASIEGSRFSAVEAASATNELAKAGYTSTSALGVLPNLMSFATAAQEDLAEATTMSSDILGGFGLRSKDAQVQIKNHIQLNDELTKASLISTGGLQDLFESLKVTAPISKELRMSRQELMAMTVALSNAGIKGDIAATAIKRATTNLFADPARIKMLGSMGIRIADGSGKLRKFTTIMGELGQKMNTMTDKQRLPILRDIFGLHGLAGSLKLMREVAQVAEYEKSLSESLGTSAAVAKMQDMSTWAKVLMVANAAMEKGFQIFEKFDGSGKKGLDVLLGKIKNLKVGPIVEALKAIAATAGMLWKVLEPFVPYLPQIVAVFIAWKGVLFAIGAAKAIPTIIKFVGTSWVALSDGVSVATAAFDFFGVSLGAVAISAGAVAAAIVSINAAMESYKTGKDNFISRAAQDAGLVPKLTTDDSGVVTGHATDSGVNYGKVASVLVPAATPVLMAINKLISELRQNSKQQVEVSFNNAPAGTTVNSSGGSPAIMNHMLGANP